MTVINEFILTSKCQASKKCKDGKYRNFIIYFLNGIQILKQKLSFDTNLEKGYDGKTSIYDEYILNGKMFQKRKNGDKVRNVSYPLSKKILETFNIPKNIKIKHINYEKDFN